MAFDKKNLSGLCYANGFTLWHYKTTADAKAALDTAGYFNDSAGQLKVGDIIIANGSDGAAILVVNANSGTVVDCGDVLAVGAADSD
jgi:hypothetical protein